MKEVNLDTWDRREHFAFFSKSDLPFYNVNFNLNITGLYEYSKNKSISLTNTLIYLTIKSMVQVQNFRYRIEGDKVVEYETLDPSFTALKNKEELFRFITVAYSEDLKVFDEKAKEAVMNSTQYFDLDLLTKRTNFVFISMLPWIPFTGIDHTLSLKRNDSIPRVSWGKFFSEGNKLTLPYNIQVNHALVDGIHVGKFYENMNEELEKIRLR